MAKHQGRNNYFGSPERMRGPLLVPGFKREWKLLPFAMSMRESQGHSGEPHIGHGLNKLVPSRI
jgi:hypothetical protein